MSRMMLIEAWGMFSNFTDVRSIVGLVCDSKRAAPLAMRVASKRVVYLRDAVGGAGELIDQCPHRGIDLSFDNRRFVQRSILSLGHSNAGRLLGHFSEAAAP